MRSINFVFNRQEITMTSKEKKELLREMITLMVYTGYDFADYLGKPLSYFNYDGVKNYIKKLQSEYEKM